MVHESLLPTRTMSRRLFRWARGTDRRCSQTEQTQEPRNRWRIDVRTGSKAPVSVHAMLSIWFARRACPLPTRRPPPEGVAGTDSHGRMGQLENEVNGQWLTKRCCPAP
jgi:hypothetical protein